MSTVANRPQAGITSLTAVRAARSRAALDAELITISRGELRAMVKAICCEIQANQRREQMRLVTKQEAK